MKTQHEATIQFSGYPLSIVEPEQIKKIELAAVKPWRDFPLFPQKSSIGNDPNNWDVAWFNSYE